jgi:hypothetical protein
MYKYTSELRADELGKKIYKMQRPHAKKNVKTQKQQKWNKIANI